MRFLAQQLVDGELPFHAGLLRLPVVVLMAEEASVLSLADLRRFAAMTGTAGLDARDKHVGGFLARTRFVVAGIASDRLVRVMIVRGVRKPTHGDVRRTHL